VGGGTIVVIPRGTWHEFTVLSDTPARMVNVHPVARMVTEWAE
jgi:quercetin dioxygenase-like cupin family protein